MPSEPDRSATHELRSFGRRRGRKVSSRQRQLLETVLPQVGFDLARPCPADLRSLFTPLVDEVWLEIGFGGGEHLLWQARRHPRVGLVGAEPFEDGVVKVLDAIEREGLPNVRVWPDDVRALLRWLPEGCLARAFILFPDPWPKARHQKRRLFAPATLDLLARALRPGGELRAATDIADYAGVMLAVAAAHPDFAWTARRPDDWRLRPDDWPETRYEQKAIAAGRRSTYLTFRRC
jgi:tRNA (guanine-N7-)-methyltransferase